MDGASRMFAAPVEITLGGRKFKAKGRLARYYGEIEQHLLSQRADPFQVVREHLSEFADNKELQEVMMRAAVAEACRMKTVTGLELREWMNTVPGTAYISWLAIRDDAPDVTREQIQEWLLEDIDDVTQKLAEIEDLRPEDAQERAQERVMGELHDSLDRASGEDQMGNSTGPPKGAGDQQGRSPGDGSAET